MKAIVMVDACGGIAKGGKQSVIISEDRKHFAELTSGHTVIMGRHTANIIGHPLPNRRNIVISTNPNYKFGDAEVYHSVSHLLHEGFFEPHGCDGEHDSVENLTSMLDDMHECYIIGGGLLYSGMAPIIGEIDLTMVYKDYGSDMIFPLFEELHDRKKWEIDREEGPFLGKDQFGETVQFKYIHFNRNIDISTFYIKHNPISIDVYMNRGEKPMAPAIMD